MHSSHLFMNNIGPNLPSHTRPIWSALLPNVDEMDFGGFSLIFAIFKSRFLHEKIIFFIQDFFSDKVWSSSFDFWHLEHLIPSMFGKARYTVKSPIRGIQVKKPPLVKKPPPYYSPIWPEAEIFFERFSLKRPKIRFLAKWYITFSEPPP